MRVHRPAATCAILLFAFLGTDGTTGRVSGAEQGGPLRYTAPRTKTDSSLPTSAPGWLARMGPYKRDPPPRKREGAPIAFVVWHADQGGPRDLIGVKQYKKRGNQVRTINQEHAAYAKGDKKDQMITMLFESARFQHPGCRVVILTDGRTEFSVELSGPPVEIVRYYSVNTEQEMLSRMRARYLFLKQELERSNQSPVDHMVLLDTDMLISGDMMEPFTKHFENAAFDIAATWRDHKDMPINGGILMVHRSRYATAAQFLAAMLRITLAAHDPTTRWFGTSDQVGLGHVMKREHGFTSTLPYTKESYEMTHTRSIYTWFMERGSEDTPAAAALRVLLLPCVEYNGNPERLRPRGNMERRRGLERFLNDLPDWHPRARQLSRRFHSFEKLFCTFERCCCDSTSRVLHFKGDLKVYMASYWDVACAQRGAPSNIGCPSQCALAHGSNKTLQLHQ